MKKEGRNNKHAFMGLICPSWLSETLPETMRIGTEFHTKKYFLKSNSCSDVLIEK